jgi:hypothetical protein
LPRGAEIVARFGAKPDDMEDACRRTEVPRRLTAYSAPLRVIPFAGAVSAALVVPFAPELAPLRTLEALAEKPDQLFRGPKPPLPAGVDFFDPSDEALLRRRGFRSELQDECASHHMLETTRIAEPAP